MAPCNRHCLSLKHLSIFDEARVKKLLNKGAHLTHLNLAVWPNLQISDNYLSTLLKYGLDVNARSSGGDTALHLASSSGRLKCVKLLLKYGADSNVRNNHGCTPISLAAMNGHDSIIKCLIKNGIDLNQVDKDDKTSLILAAENGHSNTCQILLENRALINFCGRLGTALIGATRAQHAQSLDILLKHGANVNNTTEHGETALNIAVNSGYHSISRLLLSVPGININIANDLGMTPLMTAAMKGDDAMVETLLKAKAETNVVDTFGNNALMLACITSSTKTVKHLLPVTGLLNAVNKNGQSALLLATETGSEDIVDLLIKASADVHSVDLKGNNALMIAAAKGHVKVAKLLMKKITDINFANKSGTTALMFSCKNQSDCLKLLLDNNADVLASSKNGKTALLIASEAGNYPAVNILIKSGSQIDRTDSLGETALMKAAKHASVHCGCNTSAGCSYAKIVRLLLKYKTDFRHANAQGWTTFHVACQAGNLEIVDILLRKCADTNQTNKQGRTPLKIAVLAGHAHIVKFLLNNNAAVNEQNLGCTALHIAAQARDQPEVVKLLLFFEADYQIKTTEGYTSLLLASERGHAGNVNVLLRCSKSLQISADRYYSMLYAVSRGHFECVRVFLENIRRLEARFLQLFMFVAAKEGHYSILEMLIQFDPMRQVSVSSVLNVAVKYGSLHVVKGLLSNFKPCLRQKDINAALILACIENQAEVANCMCFHGANVDYQNRNGFTPLILAAAKGNLEVVKVLISKCCNVNYKAPAANKTGPQATSTATLVEALRSVTALHMAVQCGRLECTEALLNAGADVNVENFYGCTSLTLAKLNNNAEIVNLLKKHNARESAFVSADLLQRQRSTTNIIVQGVNNLNVNQASGIDIQSAMNVLLDGSILNVSKGSHIKDL